MGEHNAIQHATAVSERIHAAFAAHESFVVFKVADLSLGLKVSYVSRVISRVALRKAPEMPPIIEGFLELAGDWIPVLNLRYLLGKASGVESDVLDEKAIHEQIVIARYAGKVIAWRCQDGTKIIQGERDDIVELPLDHVLNNCARWTLTRPNGKPGIVILEPDLLLLQEEEVRMKELAERLSQRKSLAS